MNETRERSANVAPLRGVRASRGIVRQHGARAVPTRERSRVARAPCPAALPSERARRGRSGGMMEPENTLHRLARLPPVGQLPHA